MTTSAKTPRPGRRAPYDRHRLVRRRVEAGLSQAELSEKSGVSTSQISRLELGAGGVSAPKLARLAEALGCEVKDLTPTETPHEPADASPSDVDVQRLRSEERALPDDMPELRR